MIEFLTADTSSTASLLVTFLPMVLILVFMYIILYLPQKKQDKKDAAMRASIEVGDTVITIGGVVGRVAATVSYTHLFKSSRTGFMQPLVGLLSLNKKFFYK